MENVIIFIFIFFLIFTLAFLFELFKNNNKNSFVHSAIFLKHVFFTTICVRVVGMIRKEKKRGFVFFY